MIEKEIYKPDSFGAWGGFWTIFILVGNRGEEVKSWPQILVEEKKQWEVSSMTLVSHQLYRGLWAPRSGFMMTLAPPKLSVTSEVAT